jgi:hypothetical protein
LQKKWGWQPDQGGTARPVIEAEKPTKKTVRDRIGGFLYDGVKENWPHGYLHGLGLSKQYFFLADWKILPCSETGRHEFLMVLEELFLKFSSPAGQAHVQRRRGSSWRDELVPSRSVEVRSGSGMP